MKYVIDPRLDCYYELKKAVEYCDSICSAIFPILPWSEIKIIPNENLNCDGISKRGRIFLNMCYQEKPHEWLCLSLFHEIVHQWLGLYIRVQGSFKNIVLEALTEMLALWALLNFDQTFSIISYTDYTKNRLDETVDRHCLEISSDGEMDLNCSLFSVFAEVFYEQCKRDHGLFFKGLKNIFADKTTVSSNRIVKLLDSDLRRLFCGMIRANNFDKVIQLVF